MDTSTNNESEENTSNEHTKRTPTDNHRNGGESDITPLKDAIENMEKEIINCIRDIHEQRNDTRNTAEKDQLKATENRQRQEIHMLKENILN